jgi:hypothetical protein
MEIEMHRRATFLLLLCAASISQAAEPCMTVHGRLRQNGGDGFLYVWRIGTHHDLMPDDSSWGVVSGWLQRKLSESELKQCGATCGYDLYADFLLCPTEPYKEGAAQKAKFISAIHRHYVFHAY